jgi:hypothetical protein
LGDAEFSSELQTPEKLSLAETYRSSGTDVTDRKVALLALKRCASNLKVVQSVLADSGYVDKPFSCAVKELIGAEARSPNTASGIPLP